MAPDGRGRKDNQWTYDENITQDNYKDLGYSDYSDGITNNAYTSINNTKVTLNSDGTWNERGLTSGGELYGGDGSGSVMDWVHRIVYETDQYNPIALVWDGVLGYINGVDRFGNELNTAGSTYNIVSAIPWFRVSGTISHGVNSAYKASSIALRSALANRVGKRGFTEVGFQFQKHAGRTEMNGALWIEEYLEAGVTKNPEAYNNAGYKAFKDIWRAPGSFNRVNGFIEKRLPDGRGIRLQENWQFKGFID